MVKEFIVAEKQSFEIRPEPATIEDFNAAVKAIGNANIHIKSVETKAGKDLKDADLKAFVDKTLPVLKGHLTKITAINDGMK